MPPKRKVNTESPENIESNKKSKLVSIFIFIFLWSRKVVSKCSILQIYLFWWLEIFFYLIVAQIFSFLSDFWRTWSGIRYIHYEKCFLYFYFIFLLIFLKCNKMCCVKFLTIEFNTFSFLWSFYAKDKKVCFQE